MTEDELYDLLRKLSDLSTTFQTSDSKEKRI